MGVGPTYYIFGFRILNIPFKKSSRKLSSHSYIDSPGKSKEVIRTGKNL